jgi:hypothetical protein
MASFHGTGSAAIVAPDATSTIYPETLQALGFVLAPAPAAPAAGEYIIIVANHYPGREDYITLEQVVAEAEAYEALLTEGGVPFQTLRNPSVKQFRDALEDHLPSVVIFCGHGDLEVKGDLVLGFVADDATFDVVGHEAMAGYLLAQPVRLVLLNACRTGALASELVQQRGGPAAAEHALQHVVYWRTGTQDEAAAKFGMSFVRRHLVERREAVEQAFEGAKADVTDERVQSELDSGEPTKVQKFCLQDPDTWWEESTMIKAGVPVLVDLGATFRALGAGQEAQALARSVQRHRRKASRLQARLERATRYVSAAGGHRATAVEPALIEYGVVRALEGLYTEAGDFLRGLARPTAGNLEAERAVDAEKGRFDDINKRLRELVVGAVPMAPAMDGRPPEPTPWPSTEDAERDDMEDHAVDAGGSARAARLSRLVVVERNQSDIEAAEEAVAAYEAVAPPPAPFVKASECYACSLRFSLFDRRHHCRRCGKSVCGACSPHKLHGNERGCGPCAEAEPARLVAAREREAGARGMAARCAQAAEEAEQEAKRAIQEAVADGHMSELLFVETGGNDVHCLEIGGAGKVASMIGGEGYGCANAATDAWPDDAEAKRTEVTVEIGPSTNGVYIGLMRADKELLNGEIREDEHVWLLNCNNGKLYGGEYCKKGERGTVADWANKLSKVAPGAPMTLTLRRSEGGLQFLLDGEIQGPGHSGVAGRVKLCISLRSQNNRVQLPRYIV